ncbi:MAG TPA: DNA-directed RNA polymerase subunit beta', partial [Gammaproteobacteria bacterium]|nr:DNA-directed RNA polymerase subunit beta' [Gammaproteobacteria bacterium]
DGDQMAVHVPLTLEAQLEARTLMMSTNNILAPANGEPIIVPSQDVVLGLYYMTRERVNAKGEGMVFADAKEVQRAYDTQQADLQARIKVRITDVTFRDDAENETKTEIVDTTVGRVLLFNIVPEGLPFSMVNQKMAKKPISQILNACYRNVGLKETVIFADQLMYTGYQFSTRSGSSIGVNDFVIPKEKAAIINQANSEVEEIENQFASGLVTQGEKYNKVIDIWSRANDIVAKSMMEGLSSEIVVNKEGE